ncbi:alpha/beta fold hydrolase [Patulibacter sp. S7RM1-6]
MTAPTPLVERRLDVGGVRTRALLTGARDAAAGTPFLLLHGYSDSADTWRRVLEQLATRGQRAAAIDLPGFGAADRLARDERMLDQYRRLVAGVTRELWGDEPPIVVGNSMGGALALRCAEDRPSPAGIVPIGPAGFEHPGWFRMVERQPLVRHLLSDVVPVPGPVVRAATIRVFRQLAYADPRAARRDDLVRFAAHYRGVRDVRRLLATGRRLLAELDEPFALDRVACPVLLVWGERDRMVRARGARHLLAALPDARYELLRGLGHCPQLEDPELVADLLTGFRCALSAAAPDRRPVGRALAA